MDNALVTLNVDDVVARVVTREDFVTIEGRIEIKRDLALKLSALAKLSVESHLVEHADGNYIVRVRLISADGRYAEGLGACELDEVKGSRHVHDALTRAETRALKRALELAIGLPFINEIISRLFGGFEATASKPTARSDKPTAFWSRAKSLGVSQEQARGIIGRHTASGRTDWDAALAALGGGALRCPD